jgi:phosphatidyl-myo-inositol dimannoside synthase
MRLLVIPSSDYVGHPFPQRTNYLFDSLCEMGDDVSVLRFTFSQSPRVRTCARLHSIPLEIKGRTLGSYYILNFMNHNLYGAYLAAKEKVDCVVVSNLSPYFMGFMGRALHISNVPVFFDLFDYFPYGASQFVAKEGTMTFNVLHSFLSGILKISMTNATGVTAASRLLTDYAIRAGAREAKFIPNGISDHFMKLSTQDSVSIREKLGLDGKFVIGFVGSIEFWLDFGPLLEALARLVKAGLPVHLLLIGGKLRTGYQESVFERIRDMNLKDHVTWLGFIPNIQLPAYVATFNLGLMPFDPSNPINYFLEEPLKMWEYISQGVPVVSSSVHGIETYSSNYCTIYRSTDDIYTLVKGCIDGNNLDGLTQKTKAAREYGLKNRNWKKLASDFRNYISSNLERLSQKRHP